MGIFDGTFLDGTEDWIIALLQHQIYLGPMLLLFIEEAGVPLPVPGDVTLAYLGYEVSKGLIPFHLAFLLMMVAVLSGSSILYFLSYRFGQTIILKIGKYIHLDEKKLVVVEEKFRKYGVLVVIFGRHIPGFRIPITVFAGMSDMKYSTFIVSTFISVIFWVPFYLFLGMRLGPKTAGLFHNHQGYVLFLIISSIIIFLTFLFLRKSKQAHDTMHTIHTRISHISTFIRDSETALFLFLEMALGTLISLSAFAFFINLVKDVLEKDYAHLDNTIALFFYSLRTTFLTNVMFTLSFFGSSLFLMGASVITILFLIYKRYFREALLFMIILFMGEVIDMALKLLVRRPRPHFHPLVVEHDYSFPSGHSMGAFIFYITIAYLVFRITKNKKVSMLIFSLATLLTFFIGVSRVYLGVHFPSDVIAGFVAGSFWFATVVLLDKTMVFLKLFKEYEAVR